MTEVWKPIAGFDSKYDISDRGRVRSWLKRGSRGKVRATHPTFLKPGVDRKGKLYVYLGRGNRRQVHHLVLESFIGPRPVAYEGCHKNDIPADNRVENLEWGTSKHNRQASRINGGMCVGSRSPMSKLTEDAVVELRAMYGRGHSLAYLGRKFGISSTTAGQAARMETWKHVA